MPSIVSGHLCSAPEDFPWHIDREYVSPLGCFQRQLGPQLSRPVLDVEVELQQVYGVTGGVDGTPDWRAI